MPAELVAFNNTEGLDDPKARAKQLRKEFYDVWRQLEDRFGAAYRAWPDFLENRLRLMERGLRALLNTDTLSPAQRETAVALINGAAGKVVRDGKLLSDQEAAIIAAYRRMDYAERQMIRTLCDRLAATSGRAR